MLDWACRVVVLAQVVFGGGEIDFGVFGCVGFV